MKNNKTVFYALLLSLMVIALGSAYFIGTLTTTKRIIHSASNNSQIETSNKDKKFLTKDELINTSGIIYEGITEEESGPYMTTLRKFESYHKDNDANGILALFSPPANDNEKGAQAFLEGTDINMESPISRLFDVRQLSHKLNWYLIKSIKRSGDNVLIKVLENRTYYDATGTTETNPDLYFSNQEYFILEIGKDLKIEKFHYPLVEKGSTGKYDGFFSNFY